MALITKDGFATTGFCSPSRAALEPFAQLAKKDQLKPYFANMRLYVPSARISAMARWKGWASSSV